MQLVVCGMLRTIRLEKPEQNLGHTFLVRIVEKQTFSEDAVPQGVCDSLVNALEALGESEPRW